MLGGSVIDGSDENIYKKRGEKEQKIPLIGPRYGRLYQRKEYRTFDEWLFICIRCSLSFSVFHVLYKFFDKFTAVVVAINHKQSINSGPSFSC